MQASGGATIQTLVAVVVVVAMPAMKYSTYGPGNAKHGLVFLHGWKMNAFQMRDCIKSLELDAEVRAENTIQTARTSPQLTRARAGSNRVQK